MNWLLFATVSLDTCVLSCWLFFASTRIVSQHGEQEDQQEQLDKRSVDDGAGPPVSD